ATPATRTASATSQPGSGDVKTIRPFSYTSGGYLNRNSQILRNMRNRCYSSRGGSAATSVGHCMDDGIRRDLIRIRGVLQRVLRMLGVLPGIADVRVPVDHH